MSYLALMGKLSKFFIRCNPCCNLMPNSIVIEDNNIILRHLNTAEVGVCPLTISNIENFCVGCTYASFWGCNTCIKVTRIFKIIYFVINSLNCVIYIFLVCRIICIDRGSYFTYSGTIKVNTGREGLSGIYSLFSGQINTVTQPVLKFCYNGFFYCTVSISGDIGFICSVSFSIYNQVRTRGAF